jgi:electron transport complex protein RnfD
LARLFPDGYGQLFVGNIPGSIGEVSALLLLLGAVYLFVKRIITWEVPVAYVGTFSVLIWIFGGRMFGGGVFTGNIPFHLLTGGLMLGALYMATDMVTSPLTRRGMLIFGAGCGFLTFLIRIYGSFPEGVALSIIIMNMFVPLINRVTRPAKFGAVKEGSP